MNVQRWTVVEWNNVDGGLLGAVIVCPFCDGGGCHTANGDMALVLKTDALEEIERLRMALTRFGKHDSLCNVVGDYTSTCSCGLDKEADQ